LLDNYGGHFYAAGVTMAEERVDDFIRQFEDVVAATITEEQRTPEIEIDAEIPLSYVKPAFYNLLKQLEPFGPGNMRPVFITKGLYDYRGNSTIVKEAHLRITAHQHDGPIIEGIAFNLADKYDIVRKGRFDMIYHIEENEYNGNSKLQIRVLDVRKAD
jgi:single-stranded-DNA-specific exonuclease